MQRDAEAFADLTAIILTYNEEQHIERCVRFLRSFAKVVYVVDSYSTDSTVVLAKACGAQVYRNIFVNQAQQFNWALDNIKIHTEWIMRIDADEIIEADLAVQIRSDLCSLPRDVVGISLNRKHIFMSRWVRYGGRYPLRLVRIWRNGSGRVENRWMDEHVVIQGGKTVKFEGGFLDNNLNDLTYFTDKHNKYATREAIEVLNKRHGFFKQDDSSTTTEVSGQAALKRFIKVKTYDRIPFTLSATLYFLWRYVFRLGFLDGRSGLVYHFLQGYWYRFLVGAKVMEFERALATAKSNDERLETLERLTGLRLAERKD